LSCWVSGKTGKEEMTVEQMQKEITRLTKVKNDYRRRCWSEYLWRMKLQSGLNAVSNLIADSQGVSGLHMNGDVATWDELRTGGSFEEWLAPFDDAVSYKPNRN